MGFLLEITLPAKLGNLQAFIEPVKGCAKEQGFGEKRLAEIELALEEVLVNIFNYAYEESSGQPYAKVVCQRDGDSGFLIEIEDAGFPFDVLSEGQPDVTADISDRRIGGLGVFLVRELMDDVQYRREDNKNILTLRVEK
ncbi:ATP-binding protein [Desulfococcaceae bacterium HSG8]|nr:ATP-binding protein [Desulfococcaceae bacterium HSG8]